LGNPFALYPFQAGERVRMRKAHPCGGTEWEVVRAGEDIRIRCATCGHYVSLGRRDFEKSVKEMLKKDGTRP
jgi:hypothetical protein